MATSKLASMLAFAGVAADIAIPWFRDQKLFVTPRDIGGREGIYRRFRLAGEISDNFIKGKGEDMPNNDAGSLTHIKTAEKSFLRGLKVFEIIFVILVVLSLVGVGITDFSPAHSYWYWFAMAPIFACACIIIEWTHARNEGKRWTSIFRTQFLTWFGLLVAVQAVFLLLRAGRLTYESTGLVILLLLALTTFIAGIDLGYQLCLLGGFLCLTLLMVAYLEQYIWVLVFVAVIGVGVTIYGFKRRIKRLQKA